jgi:hypothetical protein
MLLSLVEDVTRGRASWIAAFHEGGKDEQNPHAHLVVRDRDPATGRRVAQLSERGSTERLRRLWQEHANRALEAAGHAERIDHRTLKAQGIERTPTIHEGPQAQAMDRRRARPRSRLRRRANGVGARRPFRDVDYPRIDRGRSRAEFNRAVNGRETAADYWAAFDADQSQREISVLRGIHRPYEGDVTASIDVGWVLPASAMKADAGQQTPMPVHVGEVPATVPGGNARTSSGVQRSAPGKPEAHRRHRTPRIAQDSQPAGEPEFKRKSIGHNATIGLNSLNRKGQRMNDDEKRRQALEQARFVGLVYPVQTWRNGKLYNSGPMKKFSLFGPTCDSTDHMPGPFSLPAEIQAGDWLEFQQIGAYCQSTRTSFNGFGGGRLYLVDDEPVG